MARPLRRLTWLELSKRSSGSTRDRPPSALRVGPRAVGGEQAFRGESRVTPQCCWPGSFDGADQGPKVQVAPQQSNEVVAEPLEVRATTT
jgi:hypothetical protein